MNKKFAVVLGCIPVIALIGIALLFALKGTNDSQDIILRYTPLIGISNTIVAIAAIAPFIISLYYSRPLIEIDYSNKFYDIDNKIYSSFKIKNYGKSEAENPSLRILHVKDDTYTEIYNQKYRYTLLTGHYFEFYLTNSIHDYNPDENNTLLAIISYKTFFKRETNYIPFRMSKIVIEHRNITSNKIVRTESYLKPSCLDYDISNEIIHKYERKKIS